MSNTKELDKWEQILEVQIKILQECQKKNNLNSCSVCQEFIECSIRKEYIKSVYESMNKGSGGGFEF